jgi:hypothetical protein
MNAKHPPYCTASIEDCYAGYLTQMADRDVTDPCGTVISFLEENFPKLIKLQMLATGANARAAKVLEALQNGTFNSSLYTVERDRLETLFWIEDVLTDPDSIHENIHETVEAESVYVKHYDKEGAPIKLVFVLCTYAGQRVVCTSFLTQPARLSKFVRVPPTWSK